MLKNHWNALKIYLVKLLSNHKATLKPGNLENTSNFEGWDLTLVAYKKSGRAFLRKNAIMNV